MPSNQLASEMADSIVAGIGVCWGAFSGCRAEGSAGGVRQALIERVAIPAEPGGLIPGRRDCGSNVEAATRSGVACRRESVDEHGRGQGDARGRRVVEPVVVQARR